MRAKKIMLLAILLSVIIGSEAKAEKVTVGASPDSNVYQSVIDGITEADLEALREVVYWEAAVCDCPIEVDVAVVETVFNRMLSDDPYFKKSSVRDVCNQKGQFYRRSVPADANMEDVDDAISIVFREGLTVLPDTDYIYFATKRQSLGKDHIWIGGRHDDGTPKKLAGMYFCRGKNR